MQSPPGWTLTTAFPESLLLISTIGLLIIELLSLCLSAYLLAGLVLRRFDFTFGGWRHVCSSRLHGRLRRRRRVTLRLRFGRRTHQLSRSVLPLVPRRRGLCGRSAKPGTSGARAIPRKRGTQSGHLRATIRCLLFALFLGSLPCTFRRDNLVSQLRHRLG